MTASYRSEEAPTKLLAQMGPIGGTCIQIFESTRACWSSGTLYHPHTYAIRYGARLMIDAKNAMYTGLNQNELFSQVE